MPLGRTFNIEVVFGVEDNKFMSGLRNIGQSMTRAGQTLTTTLTLPIVALGGVLAKLGMDLQESQSLVQYTFGEMTADIQAWSETTSASIAASKYDVQSTAAVFFNMATGMGMTRDAAFGVATGFVELGTDFASFYNRTPVEMFEKLRSALAGESEPMRQLGIDVRQTAVHAAALAHGLISQGEAMTENVRIQATLLAIQDQGKAAMGDLERTQDSATNRLRYATARAKEMGQELGSKLVPIITDLINTALLPFVDKLNQLADSFTNLTPEQQKMILAALGLVAAIGPLLMILGQIVILAPAIGTAFAVMLGPWGLLIAAVVAGVILLVRNWDDVRVAAGIVAEAVTRAFQPVADWFSKNMPLIKETWATAWAGIQALWQTFGPVIIGYFKGTWDAIKTIFLVVWEGIKMTFENVLTFIGGFARAWMQAFNGDWSGAWTTMKETVATIWNNIKDHILNMLRDIWNGMKQWWADVTQGWKDFAYGLIGGSIIPDMTEKINATWRTMIAQMVEDTNYGMNSLVTTLDNKLELINGLLRDAQDEWIRLYKDKQRQVDDEAMRQALKIALVARQTKEESGQRPFSEPEPKGKNIADILASQRDAAKNAELEGRRKSEEISKSAREPMNRIWRDLRKNLLDNARDLGASIVKGDIGKAIQSAFDTLSSALSDAVSTSISKSMGGGFGGDLLGAFGGGLVGAGISLLGGLFSHKEKGAGEDEYNPVYASITNWEDFKLGFTLPASWIFSGRAGYHSEIGPSGWELDATRQTRRLGLHYAT